jgi:anaerobic magnesium-protoporphyrin IX monomethyl ester cyclase
MKILFANIPFIKFSDGGLQTGPNAGSRWPWTAPGGNFHGYAPFPFWLAYAAKYVQSHGFEVKLYDGVAMRHNSLQQTLQEFKNFSPDIIFYDISTPTYEITDSVARWAKVNLGARNVYCGPHMKVYAEKSIKESHVDNCVIGEFDIPALEICQRLDEADKIYKFKHLKDIDNLPDGTNFTPLRPIETMERYYDPSMDTPRYQITVSTSRGCPFKCTYCQWPKVMNNGQYRARKAENVIAEIKELQELLGPKFGSVFFDDDTWNLGKKRIEKICAGLKETGVPWTMMGRIDTSTPELYQTMVDSGCVGMRFGVETFNQELSNNVKKKLDTTKALKNLEFIVTKFKNMEFHLTTMKNLPGEVAGSWENDQMILKDLASLAAKNNNKVHWQISDCVPFPGTELWEELVAAGHEENLMDFSLYDGNPNNSAKLAETIGWLGTNYKPKFTEYSGEDGKLTNYPNEEE